MSDTQHQHHVPGYTLDELSTRIADQSVDANRLAATVAGMLETVQALATWANQQIAAGVTTHHELDVAKADDSTKRKR